MNRFIIIFYIFIGYISCYSNNNTINSLKNIDITINDAVNLALRNNLDYETEKLKLENKKWQMYTCWNSFIPNITAGFLLYRYNSYKNINANDSDAWNLNLNFNLSYTLNASLFLSLYQTIIDYKAEKINLNSAKSSLIKNVKKQYFNLVILKKNIELINDEMINAKKLYEQTKAIFEKGLSSEYNLLSSKIQYENLKPSIISLQKKYNQNLLLYKQVLGFKDEFDINLVDEIQIKKHDIESKEILFKNIENRFDIQLLKISLETLNNSKNKYIASFTPNFLFRYYADLTFQKNIFKYNWFGDYNYMNSNWNQIDGEISLGLSFPLSSWFPFSNEQMHIETATNQIIQKKFEITKARQSAKIEIESLIESIEGSKEILNSIYENLIFAQRAYEMAKEEYNVGTKNLLDVQNSMADLNKAKFNFLSEELNYISTLLDLEYASNKIFE